MIPINNIPSVRRMLRNTISTVACLLMLMQAAMVNTANAQSSLTATSVRSNSCGDVRCCELLRFVAGATTDTLTIECDTSVYGGDPSCWDWGCVDTHPSETKTLLRDALGRLKGVKLTFNPVLNTGDTVPIMICPKRDSESCAHNWPQFVWASTDGTRTPPRNTGSGVVGITQCLASEHPCTACDQVEATDDTCYEQFCITRHWFAADDHARTFVLRFVPALAPCNKISDVPGCIRKEIFLDSSVFPHWKRTNPIDEIDSNGVPVATDITLTQLNDSFPGLGACGTVCIKIPKCNPPVNHIVTAYGVPNGAPPCSPSFINVSFKEATGRGPTSASSNFPNPLTRANQFKTTIPFEILQDGGEAKVSVINDAGKLVYQDVQTFAGSGKHFFYFTGEQLPSGKYFYTIESPIGAVIVKKSLLIVK